MAWSVPFWVTVSFLSTFFWNSKVIALLSANSHRGLPWFNGIPSLKNLMFLKRKISVLLFSACGTCKYSQESIAQKKAPMPSCPRARSVSVCLLLCIMIRTWAGRFFLFDLYLCCGRPRRVLIKLFQGRRPRTVGSLVRFRLYHT